MKSKIQLINPLKLNNKQLFGSMMGFYAVGVITPVPSFINSTARTTQSILFFICLFRLMQTEVGQKILDILLLGAIIDMFRSKR